MTTPQEPAAEGRMPVDRPIIFSAQKRDEFESLVIPEPNSGCWIFLGKLNERGYGRFAHGRYGLRPAHQASLDLAGRPRPPGLEPDHTCKMRCCVNPDHLEYVTHRENLLRGDTIAARAAAKTTCPAGHPLSGINLMVRSGKRGCRQCDRDRQNNKYKPTTTRRRRKHLTKAERAEIKALIRKNVPHSRIAKIVGVSIATVSHVRTGKNRYDRPANNL